MASRCFIVGLTLYPKPRSTNQIEGHCADATIKDRLGGVNKINFGRSGK
jgi:hypothetical protein